MNPGLSASCFILFEVAKDTANLKLRLTQEPQDAQQDPHVVEFDLELD